MKMIKTEKYELYIGNCLSIMNGILDNSVDMIFCDLPYGTTQNEWDKIIPFEQMWKQIKRIAKKRACIALWSQPPFDKALGMSNIKNFKYEWIIEKTKATGHLNAKKAPMKAHENVLIFYNKPPTYNPQMTEGHTPTHFYTKHTSDGSNYGETKTGICGGGSTQRYPRDVLKFKWDTQIKSFHPNQKPVEACEYFIKTYTNENDLVLDFCMGSGTTGVACMNTNRKFIGIEISPKSFRIAKNRINDADSMTEQWSGDTK